MTKDWKNAKELIEYSRDGILSKELFKADENNVTLFCMASGTEISEHTSTKEGFVFVLEGKGTFNLDGKDIEMQPGVVIYLKKNIAHSIKAEENTAFALFLGGN